MSTPPYSPLIQALGTIGLRVPDLDKSVAHAIDVVGMRETERTESTSYLTCDRTHHSVEYTQGDEVALDHIGLKAYDERSVAEITARLDRDGVRYETVERPGVGEAIRVKGPDGHAFEVYARLDANEPAWYPTAGLRPNRFGHVTISAEDIRPTEDFLARIFDFKVSDRISDWSGTWMRCGSTHHVVAVIKAPVGIHHYAFDVSNLTEIGRLGDLLGAHGGSFLFGPGRHALGWNIYCYYRDPAGTIIEVTTDMEHIDDPDRPPGSWDPKDPTVENLWGPLWTDPDFGRITPNAGD